MSRLSLRTGGIPMGTVYGIKLRLHILFLVFFAIQLVFTLNFDDARGKRVAWAALMYGPILLSSLLLHAVGAAFACRRFGGSFTEVIFWPLGSLFHAEHPGGPKEDLLISLAGPLTHLPQAAFWAGLAAIVFAASKDSFDATTNYQIEGFAGSLFVAATLYNIALFVFNTLIPAVPLNGGNILADLMLMCNASAERAAQVVAVVSVVVGIGLIVLGAIGLFFGLAGIFIGIFVLFATWELFQHIRDGTLDQHRIFARASSQGAVTGAGGDAQKRPSQV